MPGRRDAPKLAAWLFGGWAFSKQRPGDLALLPDDLRATLLARGLACEDEDRKGRARRAFSRA